MSSLGALHASPLVVFLSLSRLAAIQLASPTKPAAIDTNLRNFFGPATCHRVTAHPPTGVPSRTAGDREGVRFADVGEGRGAGEVETIESPALGKWSSAATVAILGTLIERINRERAGRETKRARAAFFAGEGPRREPF